MSSTAYFKHADPESGINEIFTGVKEQMPQPDFNRSNNRRDSSILKKHLLKGIGVDKKLPRSNSTHNVMKYKSMNGAE